VGCELGAILGVRRVGGPLVGVEVRIETVGVQVEQIDVVAGAAERGDGAVAQGRCEAALDRMGVHDERPHSAPSSRVTCVRKASRCSGVLVSIP
jgi:hypothetical protein